MGKQEDTNNRAYFKFPDSVNVDCPITTDCPLAVVDNSPAQYKLFHYTRCVAPANPDATRTTIGIGEVVDFGGMPGYTTWTLDGLGSLDGGNGVMGDGATFIAAHSPGSATVHAWVGDLDFPTPFSVIAPTGISASLYYNVGFGTLGTNSIGADTQFQVFVNPQTVSFNNNTFNETNGPTNVIISWPNGTNLNYPIEYRRNLVINCNDTFGDEIRDGEFPISNLFNGSSYGSCGFTVTWTDQYLNEAGQWTNFATMKTTTTFNADGTTRHTYQNAIGANQGPWQ